jgi:hypothetical protein
MMFRSILAATAAAFLCLPTLSQAAKVKVWHQHTPSHYDRAHFKDTVVSSEGSLRLAHQLRPLATLDATHVWDVIEDKDGNLLVATGDEGKLFKVTPDGKVSVLFTSADSQILCLAATANGVVYAGTGPAGQIVRLTPDGKAQILYSSPETYIWCLAYDSPGQTLYAGIGPKGRVLQISPEGKPQVFYTTKQDHILSLAVGPDRVLYAGTDKNGLVYRIDPRGKGFVLYSAPQAEVRSLLVMADGVYAATSSPTRKRTPASTPSSAGRASLPPSTSGNTTLASSSGKEDGTSSEKEDSAVVAAVVNNPPSTALSAVDGGKGNPAAAPPSPVVGENSLYRIAPDGTVREIFREKALLLSLLKQNGRILIGTGMEGQLFEVDENTKERSEVARLDHGQIHSIYRRRDGSIVLGTGDPGKLYVLQDRYTAQGTIVSDVLDAKIISKWGSLRWQADKPAGTSVTVAVRSGNVQEPDETWSDWSAEQTDPQQAIITAPTARFLQYRVTLTSENPAATPSLQGVALRYMTTNQAPEITTVDVPDLDVVNLENPKKLRFKWTATDPNEDELTYALYVRKDGWKNWVQLEENYEKTEYEWDTTTTPSGIYHLKVVASDRKDNPAEDALNGERLSSPFAVSHTPPTVTMKVVGIEGDQAILEATATDPLVRLTAASFAVNGKKWVSVFPVDGLFDSKQETFRFKTEVLTPGTYVVVLRVRDAAGNIGSGDVVFTVNGHAAQP